MIIYDKLFKINKNFLNQLNLIYGLSTCKNKNIFALLGLKDNTTLEDFLELIFKDDFAILIKDLIDKDKRYLVENILKYQNILKRKDLKILNNYKSMRFNQYLPVNGQRTRKNAKTQKKRKGNNL